MHPALGVLGGAKAMLLPNPATERWLCDVHTALLRAHQAAGVNAQLNDVLLSPDGRTITEADPASQVGFVVVVCRHYQKWAERFGSWIEAQGELNAMGFLRSEPHPQPGLLLARLILTPPSVLTDEMLRDLALMPESSVLSRELAAIVEARMIDRRNRVIEEAAQALVGRLASNGTPQDRRWIARFEELSVGKSTFTLVRGDAWVELAIRDIEAAEQQREHWRALLWHCRNSSSAAPSSKWRKTAKTLVATIGHNSFRDHVLAWFALTDKPGTRFEHRFGVPPERVAELMDEVNADVLKGLIWCCADDSDPRVARGLTDVALGSFRKVPGVGPRLVRVGNACVWALGAMGTRDSLAQLAILAARVKFGTAQKCINKALSAAAVRMGVSRDEIEELAVPAYGLGTDGARREAAGEYTLELRVIPGACAALRVLTAAGKTLKSIPAAVKSEHADAVRELRGTIRDIDRMLAAQRERLDLLLRQNRSWPLAAWRERYLDHPLVSQVARRLIWRFGDADNLADGAWHDGALVDLQDRPLAPFNDTMKVSLWHPLNVPPDTVLAWREWLERHRVQQPFKQAHREIYLVTDAERATAIYSNRFAAHILRQHQFNALCAARGWRNKLRLMVDAEYPPASLVLPQWNLRAEYWFDTVGADFNEDTNVAGVYHFVATDQVRFYPLTAAQARTHATGGGYEIPYDQIVDPLPLHEIPPLIFSEVMRDVDLFVGVASVGNDPAWGDTGRERLHARYWNNYAFGDLNESAKTRRAVLERLIPALSIADRCRLTDRFLQVRGNLHTYQIHLGSANIQMLPQNRYLCIVPSRGAALADRPDVFLPFEGDQTLSVILSKAFMLAEDRKISDPSILRQLSLS